MTRDAAGIARSRSEEHPGIVFRPGPTGRRAGVAGGPDVYEVISALHAIRDDEPELAEDALVEATAQVLGLSRRAVWVAVHYYVAYREEIDERIKANREAADEAEAAWLAR